MLSENGEWASMFDRGTWEPLRICPVNGSEFGREHDNNTDRGWN